MGQKQFEEIMAETPPNLVNEIKVQEAQQILSRINMKKTIPGHEAFNVLKTKDQ